VLYYGDEIGMGDNIWLGDRDGVRTPMQWTSDRNAGFSSANPGKLSRPLVQDPVYGYLAVNVEAQQEDRSSLLHWTRDMIHARKKHPALRSEVHCIGVRTPPCSRTRASTRTTTARST
jgi:maltose alpha-D-glucosyltransferase/alpha-amylase